MHTSPSLRSQKGQMAIFLVLIFQVLFVFFAMTINVGLVVYDKITLQNATDIAAYYAAQRQAELLNQIAHVNYQVRQAYKLLTFRVRVFGSLSVGIGPRSTLPPHPLFQAPNINQEKSPFFDRFGSGRRPPGVCVGSSLWEEYYKADPNSSTVSLCRDLTGFSAVPPTGGGGGILSGIVGSLDAFLNQIRADLESKCKTVGVLNWQLAASFLQAYQLEAEKRAKMIDDMAKNMSAPAMEMRDFRGDSVYEGVRKTLSKNVTDAMAGSLQVTLINSLSSDVPGPCSTPEYWLPKVEIYPIVSYVRMIWSGLRCSNTIVSNRSDANLPPAEYLAQVGGGRNNQLAQVWSTSAPFPMGVEKNPWCMPYMAVRASSQPRKIFAPFGQPTVLQAEAFAKPFGGRVGPWYSSQWPNGNNISQGGERVDPLLPARSVSGSPGGGDPADDMVNYSKYPGDTLGMNSTYALGAMSQYWTSQVVGSSGTSNLKPVLALSYFNHSGDASAFETAPNSMVNNDKLRMMEEAATAPDFFDILYYSIEGQYTYNYFHPQDQKFQSFLMGGEYYVDLGSQNRAPYSLVDQYKSSNAVFGEDVFFMSNHPDQLLTGWTQNRATDYSFPDTTFGRCLQRRDDDMANSPGPGGCPHGGRSGYSVKIVSKKYLNNINAELGGVGQTGSIENPPGELPQQ